jgi:DNA-binding MarR family transcriptional regulator
MLIMFDDIPLDDDEQHVWRAYVTMQRAMYAHIQAHLRQFGLSGADYEILQTLAESPSGRMRAFELGEVIQWETSRISHQLSRMAQRGLVCREATQDPRYADIVLTEQGRDAIAKAAPQRIAAIRTWFVNAIGHDRLDEFARDCEAVTAAVKDHTETTCEL